MRLRNGFVSNSSTSSFIVTVPGTPRSPYDFKFDYEAAKQAFRSIAPYEPEDCLFHVSFPHLFFPVDVAMQHMTGMPDGCEGEEDVRRRVREGEEACEMCNKVFATVYHDGKPLAESDYYEKPCFECMKTVIAARMRFREWLGETETDKAKLQRVWEWFMDPKNKSKDIHEHYVEERQKKKYGAMWDSIKELERLEGDEEETEKENEAFQAKGSDEKAAVSEAPPGAWFLLFTCVFRVSSRILLRCL